MRTTRAWVLFGLSSVIWGVPYLFIKVAVDDGVPPVFVAWARVALGAVVVAPLALRRDAFRGMRGRGGAIAAYTACEIAVPFVLIAMGERYISSSLTATLVAAMPLLVVLLSARVSPEDRPTGRRLVGLLIGFGGVVALLGADVAGRPTELLGAALVLGATLAYAAATLIVDRKLADLDPLGPVAASLTAAAVVLLPSALMALPPALPSAPALVALGVLGVVCTAAGLIVFFALIREVGPGRASVITYVNPLVAVIVGVVALQEHVGAMSAVGLLLILGGSWVSTGGIGAAAGHEKR